MPTCPGLLVSAVVGLRAAVQHGGLGLPPGPTMHDRLLCASVLVTLAVTVCMVRSTRFLHPGCVSIVISVHSVMCLCAGL